MSSAPGTPRDPRNVASSRICRSSPAPCATSRTRYGTAIRAAWMRSRPCGVTADTKNTPDDSIQIAATTRRPLIGLAPEPVGLEDGLPFDERGKDAAVADRSRVGGEEV